MSVPDAPVYFPQAFSFHTYPAHTLKQGLISQRNWDYMVPLGSSLQNVPFKLQPQGNAPELQLPFKLHPQGNTQELQLQDFQYFVVIDFEATCDMGTRLSPQEIVFFYSSHIWFLFVAISFPFMQIMNNGKEGSRPPFPSTSFHDHSKMEKNECFDNCKIHYRFVSNDLQTFSR